MEASGSSPTPSEVLKLRIPSKEEVLASSTPYSAEEMRRMQRMADAITCLLKKSNCFSVIEIKDEMQMRGEGEEERLNFDDLDAVMDAFREKGIPMELRSIPLGPRELYAHLPPPLED